MSQLGMASDSSHENSLKALVIVLLMIFQIMSLTNAQLNTDPQSELTTDSSVQSSQSVSDLNLDFKTYRKAAYFIRKSCFLKPKFAYFLNSLADFFLIAYFGSSDQA